MKLSNNTLTNLVHGAVYNKTVDKGYVVYYRCNKEQMEYLKLLNTFLYERTLFSASITIEFFTDADSFSFDYKCFTIGSKDSFDVYVGEMLYKLISLDEVPEKGSIKVTLPKGNKRVVLYLPADLEVGIKNFQIDGKWKKIPKRKETLLCYGDSITHGYGSMKSSLTYINVMNRTMKYNVINQALGGYWFDENYIVPIEGVSPNKILISLGTNQLWSSDKYERIDRFFAQLDKVYPNIPVFVITPIWRGDTEEGLELIKDLRDYLFNKLFNYSNITVVDGLTLVPHLDYFFMDRLHPNALGMEIYGNNVTKEMKKINN